MGLSMPEVALISGHTDQNDLDTHLDPSHLLTKIK